MTNARIHGARESSAGDEFHVLWAVRRTLGLLDPDSALERIVMEDLTPVPPDGVAPELLLGVDLTEFYGGIDPISAERIVVSQLKYSHRHPDRSWTAARLAQVGSRGQKGVLARLADIYTGLSRTVSREELLSRLEIRVVSNMPCGTRLAAALGAAQQWLVKRQKPARRADLLAAVSSSSRVELERLSKASGLGSFAFTDFLRVLDVSYMGVDGRADQELAITQALARHVMDDLRHASLALADLVRKRGAPEGEGYPIERADLLAALEVHSEIDLLPAPPRFSRPTHCLQTPDAKRILAALAETPDRRVLAHGSAGVGKTTTILALEEEMPEGSVVLTYDCFGAGDYEDPGAARHLAVRFGVQICNELAARCRLPMLIRPSRSVHDLWHELERRLLVAGGLLENMGARLLLVVDAADNSALAGKYFAEKAFLSYLWALPIPPGVSLIVTCRTGRRDTVAPPAEVAQVELLGFDEAASGAYLRTRFPEAGEEQARAFHERSGGNPRVQFYVLFQERADAAIDLDEAVKQAQKTPEDIFQSLFDAAVAHAPVGGEAQERLAELLCLTKPLTSDRFRSVSGLAAERVRDFCESLVPGVVVDRNVIAFRDEDFAHFLRKTIGEAEEVAAHNRLADLFLEQQTDPYAALVVADHLHNAGRGNDLVTLALEGGPPEAIREPLGRQQVYRRRLTLALRHAAEEAEPAAACRLVVLAGEAARQNRAVTEILRRRPDLGMRYGDPEAVMRVYTEAENPEWQGPVHMQLAALFARTGEHDRARIEVRQADAWLLRWTEEERQWDVEADDVAAYAEAFFHVRGPDAAAAQLQRWRPTSFVASAAVALVRRLARSVSGQRLGALIAGRDLPATLRARLLAAAFGAGALAESEDVAAVAGLLIKEAPELGPEDGWWVASFSELCAIVGLGSERVLELLNALDLPRPRTAPHRYERLGRYRDVLRIAALRTTCTGSDLDLEDLMPASVTDHAEDSRQRSDVDSERRSTEKNVGRYVPVFTRRARALLHHTAVNELRAEFEETIAKGLHTREHRRESDFGHRMWLAAFTDALLACKGTDIDLIRNAAAGAGTTAGVGEHACLMTIARRLVQDERYCDEGLRILEHAAALTEQRELPASEQADALLGACAIADPVDCEHARDLHARAIRAAEGMDDDGIGRLELHARIASQLTGTPAAAELAWRTGHTLVRHCRRVSDEEHLPWRDTLRAITLLHPQTGVAFVGRWEDEGHLGLSSSVPAAAPALAESGFLRPVEALALQVLAGEEANPVSSATAILELIPEGPTRAAALSELSLRIRRDLLPDSRAWAAQSLHEWAGSHGLADVDAVRALQPLLESAEERRRSRPWMNSVTSDRDERERAAKKILSRARKGDPERVVCDLHELAALSDGTRISSYLETVADAVIPSRRGELADALAALPVTGTLTDRHADKILNALVQMSSRWNASTAVRVRCAAAIERLVEKQIESMMRYRGQAERVVARVLALDCLADPAALVMRVVGASLERLPPVALYETASELALGLEREERAELLSWSLQEMQGEPIIAPPLPDERQDVLAGLFWSLFAAPDKATRWRAAHVARGLLVSDDEELARALYRHTRSHKGGPFTAPGLPFYWHSAQVWTLMTIARVARDTPSKVATLASDLASTARDRDWPHASVREFARLGALSISEAVPGALSVDEVAELRFANAPRACKLKRERRYYRTGHGNRDYETERFHFDAMDTLPYVYGPFGERFGLDIDEICERAEHWIIDGLGFSDERVGDPRVERMDYSLRDNSHGSSPRVESWHEALEYHALQLVAGELCDQGAAVVVGPDADTSDPWGEWLSEHLDSREHDWIADEREPVPPVPALLMTDLDENDWPDLTDIDLEHAIGAWEADSLIIDASIEFSARFGYGTTYVTSALVSRDTAPALARALQSNEESHGFPLPIEHGFWRNEETNVQEGEFRLEGWLWEERRQREDLERHDPLARIDPVVTRPGTAFLKACGGEIKDEGWRVREPGGKLLAWQYAWSDLAKTDTRRSDPQGTSGRATHVRRDALSQLLRATGMLLILYASARRRRSDRYRNEEEESEKANHKVYLFDPDAGLSTVEGPIEARRAHCQRAR